MIKRDARLEVVAPASALEEDNPLSGAGVAADVVGNGRSIKAYSSILNSRGELHKRHVIWIIKIAKRRKSLLCAMATAARTATRRQIDLWESVRNRGLGMGQRLRQNPNHMAGSIMAGGML